MRLVGWEACEQELDLSGESSAATDVLLDLTVRVPNREDNLETTLEDAIFVETGAFQAKGFLWSGSKRTAKGFY